MTYPGESAAMELKSRFPYTVRLLGERCADAVDRYRAGGGRHDPEAATEAGSWVGFLRSSQARALGFPPYLADVASLELATAALAAEEEAAWDAAFVTETNARLPAPTIDEVRGLVAVSGRHVRIEHFDFDVCAITRAIDDCDRLEPVLQPCPSTVMLLRSSGDGPPRALSVSPSTEALLAACDGHTDWAGIVRSLAPGPSDRDDQLEAQVLGAMKGLRSVNVLTLISGMRVPRP